MMREVITISVPKQIVLTIKKTVKHRGFSSVSSYMNYLVLQDQDLITPTELEQSIRRARKEYKGGKTLRANSLAELL